jgi:hypothetical protein
VRGAVGPARCAAAENNEDTGHFRVEFVVNQVNGTGQADLAAILRIVVGWPMAVLPVSRPGL